MTMYLTMKVEKDVKDPSPLGAIDAANQALFKARLIAAEDGKDWSFGDLRIEYNTTSMMDFVSIDMWRVA